MRTRIKEKKTNQEEENKDINSKVKWVVKLSVTSAHLNQIRVVQGPS